MLADFLDSLETGGIEYVVVGDPRTLPVVRGDVDIVVAPESFEAVLNEPGHWFTSGYQRVQGMRHEVNAISVVLAGSDVDGVGTVGPELLPVDICTDYVRRARRLLGAEDLLHGRRRYESSEGGLQVWVPRPDAALTYYLIKKAAKGNVGVDGFTYLAEIASACDEPPERLRQLVGSDHSLAALECLRSGSLADLQILLPSLQRELLARTAPTLAALIQEFGRVVDRLLQPTGLLLELDCEDDVQARAVGSLLQDALGRAFRRTSFIPKRRLTIPWSIELASHLRALVTSTLVVSVRQSHEQVVSGRSVRASRLRLVARLSSGEDTSYAARTVVGQAVRHLAERERDSVGRN